MAPQGPQLRNKGLWLAVDKIIHDDDIQIGCFQDAIARGNSDEEDATPKNERLPRLVGPGNTSRLKSRLPATSKYSIFVRWATFTSVNTAPNPVLVADCAVPGITKSVSVIVLFKALKILWGLNVLKSAG